MRDKFLDKLLIFILRAKIFYNSFEKTNRFYIGYLSEKLLRESFIKSYIKMPL